MNKNKYIEKLDFDELKEICLSQSGPAPEIYISLIYFMIMKEVGHKITQSDNRTIFELLPQTQKNINVLCDKIHFLSKISLIDTDITQVMNKESAQNYVASLSGNRHNEYALNYSFQLIEQANILIEKDKLTKKIKSLKNNTKNDDEEIDKKNKMKL